MLNRRSTEHHLIHHIELAPAADPPCRRGHHQFCNTGKLAPCPCSVLHRAESGATVQPSAKRVIPTEILYRFSSSTVIVPVVRAIQCVDDRRGGAGYRGKRDGASPPCRPPVNRSAPGCATGKDGVPAGWRWSGLDFLDPASVGPALV